MEEKGEDEKNNNKNIENQNQKENKEEKLFEVIKTPEWDKIVPHILSSIEKNDNPKSNFVEYPYFRIQNAVQYLPKLDQMSEILNNEQLKELHSRLPNYHQYTTLYRIFSLSVDGSDLKSFYNKCEGINNSILLIKDDEKNIFGAYSSEVFTPTSKFSGTGECFLFTFYKGNKIHVFGATGINDNYMYCDHEQICFGCSNDYFSLSLRNHLLDGYSKSTETYHNEPLNDKDSFVIFKLELFGFKKN